jgi:hypothetical protein
MSRPIKREYLTRRELAQYLTENGYPISFSRLNHLCAPSRGEGPPLAGVWDGRGYYDPPTGLAWGLKRFRTTKLTRGQRRAGRDRR